MSTTIAQTSTGQTKQPRQSPRRTNVILATIQVVLVCGIAIVGGQALCSMLGPLPVAPQGPEPTVASSLPPMPLALPAEGTWTMADSPMALGVEIIEADRLADRMANPPINETEIGEANGSVDDSFLTSIRLACQVRETTGGYTVYSMDQPRMQLRLFSRVSGAHERLIGGYLAYSRGPRSWTLVVGTFGGAKVRRPEQPHLLPLTESAHSIGARSGKGGKLQCEVVEVHGDFEALCRLWQNAGWSIQRAAHETGEKAFSCTRGSEHVRVHPQHDAVGHSILLLIDVHALLDIGNQNSQKERASS